jgi:hypothetical protein
MHENTLSKSQKPARRTIHGAAIEGVSEKSAGAAPKKPGKSVTSLAFFKKGGAYTSRRRQALDIESRVNAFHFPGRARDPPYDKLMDNFMATVAKLKATTKDLETMQGINGAMMVYLQEIVRDVEEKCHGVVTVLKNTSTLFFDFYNEAIASINLIAPVSMPASGTSISTNQASGLKLSSSLRAIESSSSMFDRACLCAARIQSVAVDVGNKVTDLSAFLQGINVQTQKYMETPNEVLREYLKKDERNKETTIRLKRQLGDLQTCLDAFVNRQMSEGVSLSGSNGNAELNLPAGTEDIQRLVKIVREMEEKFLAKCGEYDGLQKQLVQVSDERASLRQKVEELKRQAREEKESRVYGNDDSSFCRNDAMVVKALLEETEEDLSKTKIHLAKTLEMKTRIAEELKTKSNIVQNQALKLQEMVTLCSVSDLLHLWVTCH